jgi:outer membrane protein
MSSLAGKRFRTPFLLIIGALAFTSAPGLAATQALPSAPPVSLMLAQSSNPVPVPAPAQNRLTRAQAEQLAIRHNPHISVSQLLALAQHQVVRETRSAELPSLNGSITAQQAHEGGRLSSGGLSATRLLTHAGGGVNFSQLITDFGRTPNLVAAAKLREEAAKSDAQATLEDIVLATDQAFYSALQAQAVLQVAQQTVATRQATQVQVSQLTKNKLRSTLDLGFAEVNLSQAQLLVLDAKNNADAAMAALNEVLGLDTAVAYTLVDDSAPPAAPPVDINALTAAALHQRPDLQAANLEQQSALKYSRAEHDLRLPTITALGTTGGTPVRDGRYYVSSWDGAIGLNLNVPLFNGFLYSSQAKEADLRAQSAGEQKRALRDVVVRDVRTAWLEATSSYQREPGTACTDAGGHRQYQRAVPVPAVFGRAQLSDRRAALTQEIGDNWGDVLIRVKSGFSNTGETGCRPKQFRGRPAADVVHGCELAQAQHPQHDGDREQRHQKPGVQRPRSGGDMAGKPRHQSATQSGDGEEQSRA